MTPFWSRFLQIRHTLKTLDRIASHLGSIDRSLSRIADYLSGPVHEQVPESELRIHSGVSFSHDIEQVFIQEFADQFKGKIGRDPTEEEVLEFLNGRSA